MTSCVSQGPAVKPGKNHGAGDTRNVANIQFMNRFIAHKQHTTQLSQSRENRKGGKGTTPRRSGEGGTSARAEVLVLPQVSRQAGVGSRPCSDRASLSDHLQELSTLGWGPPAESLLSLGSGSLFKEWVSRCNSYSQGTLSLSVAPSVPVTYVAHQISYLRYHSL